MRYIQKHTRAFTLIETLVAISILTVAVAAPLSLASQSLFAAYYARDQVIATQLAQEGVEIIRQMRDSQAITILQAVNGKRSNWLAHMPLADTVGARVTVAVDASDITTPQRCDSLSDDACAPLFFTGSLYRSAAFLTAAERANAKPSRFRRVVELERIAEDQLRVRSVVRWQTGSFAPRTISAEEVLYNWLPKDQQ